MKTKLTDISLSIPEESPIGIALKQLYPGLVVEGKLNLDALESFLEDDSQVAKNSAAYGLDWYGKKDALKMLRIQPKGTLLPVLSQSYNPSKAKNVVITGENLEVMKIIQKAYFGAFKMIYMDPPYNTGSDFIFDDDPENPLGRYFEVVERLKSTEGVSANNIGRNMNSRWLTMMLPRLFVARNLLAEDGVICVSIDDHEVHYLRMIMDDIFGAENFVCSFIWEKRYSPAPDAKDVAYVHENILCYKRSDAFQAGLLPMTDEQKSRYKNPDNDPRGPWKSADYTCRFSSAERPTLYYPIINPNTGAEVYPKTTRVWACSVEEHKKNVAENRIWWPSTASVPAKKSFLSDIKQGGMPTTLLRHEIVGHTDEATKELRKWFPGIKVPSKPTKLLKHLLKIANVQDGDLVLDCFAGTGTMAEAVCALNEEEHTDIHFVLIQFPEPITNEGDLRKMSDLTVGRSVGSVRQSSKSSADGVACFELSTSSFVTPASKKPASEEELIQQLSFMVNNVASDRSENDILYEIMVRFGLKLTETMEKHEVEGIPLFGFLNNKYLICPSKAISEAFAKEIISLFNPQKVICLDVAFECNDALKTNIALEMQRQGISFTTI